ncbi:MAG: SH3 domain-containing protein [Bacteroidales bacterium]|nr:SH3 domain-containing protein [Bacteroidales bacterium]
MKKAVIILSILMHFSAAYSQSCGIAEKEAINNMVLYKAYFHSPHSAEEILSTYNGYTTEGYYCYFDGNSILRKLIFWSEYPESSYTRIAYYSEIGELMYILFSHFDTEGYSSQGIAYKMCGGEYRDSVAFRYNAQYEFGVDFKNTETQGAANKYPSVIGDWRLSNYIHIDSLKWYLEIEEIPLQPLPNCKKVRFDKPSSNQTTYTNSLNINLREQPNTSSKIIGTMTIGERVKILDVLHQENINNSGNHNWYKIDRNGMVGYIFGAFLEPVEKVIE